MNENDIKYVCKAKTNIIKFTSRASVKIKDSFYTFEYGEERQIDNFDDTNISLEIESLCTDCNKIVDAQIQEVVDMITHK